MTKRWMCLMAVLGMVLSGTAMAAFTDDFNRPDSDTVGNGWTETGSYADLNPRISGNTVAFGSTGNSYGVAAISHTFDPATEISVDLAWWRDQSYNSYMAFDLTGTAGTLSVIDRKWNGSIIPIQIVYRGTESWSYIPSGPQDYHTYTVKTTDAGQTQIYIDGTWKWSSSDGGIGQVSQATITVVRDYWEWQWFNADNFAAVPEPASVIIMLSGLVVGLRRK